MSNRILPGHAGTLRPFTPEEQRERAAESLRKAAAHGAVAVYVAGGPAVPTEALAVARDTPRRCVPECLAPCCDECGVCMHAGRCLEPECRASAQARTARRRAAGWPADQQDVALVTLRNELAQLRDAVQVGGRELREAERELATLRTRSAALEAFFAAWSERIKAHREYGAFDASGPEPEADARRLSAACDRANAEFARALAALDAKGGGE